VNGKAKRRGIREWMVEERKMGVKLKGKEGVPGTDPEEH